jgi:hypothetical protein
MRPTRIAVRRGATRNDATGTPATKTITQPVDPFGASTVLGGLGHLMDALSSSLIFHSSVAMTWSDGKLARNIGGTTDSVTWNPDTADVTPHGTPQNPRSFRIISP